MTAILADRVGLPAGGLPRRNHTAVEKRSCPAEAVASKHVSLPSSCCAAIKDNRWYWGMDQNGDTQAVWSYNDHVYVATANLQKKDLIDYLRTSYRMGQ